MARSISIICRVAVMVAFAMLSYCILPAAASAKSINLFKEFEGFALREPQFPPPPGRPITYSATNEDPNWVISQYNIPGTKLSPFALKTEGGDRVYRADAPAANVKVVESSAGDIITLSENGGAVPCTTTAGQPREADLFLNSITPPVGIRPGTKSGYSLDSLKTLREIVTVGLSTAPSNPVKGCKVSKGGVMMAIIANDFSVWPHQVFFYQISLNDYCRSDVPFCRPPALTPKNFSGRNPFGGDDRLALVGQAGLQNGETRNLNIDLLPRLKLAIEDGPKNMDRDPSHWKVTGGYFGLVIFGDVKVSGTWQNYRLTAETK